MQKGTLACFSYLSTFCLPPKQAKNFSFYVRQVISLHVCLPTKLDAGAKSALFGISVPNFKKNSKLRCSLEESHRDCHCNEKLGNNISRKWVHYVGFLELKAWIIRFKQGLRYDVQEVKQSQYMPRDTLSVPEDWGFHISRQSPHEGGKVVSPMHRLPLLQEIFLVLIFVRA
jgi:hypothetical protein